MKMKVRTYNGQKKPLQEVVLENWTAACEKKENTTLPNTIQRSKHEARNHKTLRAKYRQSTLT